VLVVSCRLCWSEWDCPDCLGWLWCGFSVFGPWASGPCNPIFISLTTEIRHFNASQKIPGENGNGWWLWEWDECGREKGNQFKSTEILWNSCQILAELVAGLNQSEFPFMMMMMLIHQLRYRDLKGQLNLSAYHLCFLWFFIKM